MTLDKLTVGNYDGIKVVNVIDWLLNNNHINYRIAFMITQKQCGFLYHILNHNLTVITLMIAAVRSAVMAAKRVWRIF